MPEKNGQLAHDYVLEMAKNNYLNLVDILSFRENVFGGKYKDVNVDGVADAWMDAFLDGWIRPSDPVTSFINTPFKLTSYGKSQLGLIGDDYYPAFLDPESTISGLKSAIPNIDSIALRYFEEALWAIKKRLFLSATITMGGASESSILSLVEALLDYYSDASLSREFDKIDKIKPKFDLLLKTIRERNLKKDLLDTFKADRDKCEDIREIFINVETTLRRMFDIYRINRNDAGHPTDIGSDPDITRAEAAMFKKYCKIIYGLISYMNDAKSLKKGLSIP